MFPNGGIGNMELVILKFIKKLKNKTFYYKKVIKAKNNTLQINKLHINIKKSYKYM